jgi:hypothetical protein
MAKDFKLYDKLYASYRGRFFAYEDTRAINAHAAVITGWPYKVFNWSADEVHLAVYNSQGWEEWQKFRVSLKGQTTQLKLARLYGWVHRPEGTSEMNRCRVDNYLNALKRGGLLDAKMQIVPTQPRVKREERANAL